MGEFESILMNLGAALLPVVTAGGFAAWSAFHPRAQLFGPVTFKTPSGCALTFDDGPNPRVTPRLLDLLDEYGVPATFFILGRNARRYPELVREIAARRHEIGNHSFSHRSLIFFSRQQIVDELSRCEEAIFEASGDRSRLVRPPFGFRNPQFHRATVQLGMSHVVAWSVNGRDWNPQPSATTIRRLGRAESGDIVLLHDGDHRVSEACRDHMLKALAHWLPRWKNTGLQLVRL